MLKNHLRIYLTTVLFFQIGISQAQRLKIGDYFNGIQLSNIYNYSTQSVHTKDFKGKIVIFDYWGSRCTPCIKSMPRLRELQVQFKDDMQIFLVTDEKKKYIEDYFQKRQELKQLGLPIITEDSILKHQFPFNSVPHVIWVGKDSRVKAITGTDELEEQNIRGLLQNGLLNVRTKKTIENFDFTSNSLLDLVKNSDDSFFYSFLSKEIPGFPSTAIIENLGGNSLKMVATNYPLLNLYLEAYKNDFYLNPNNMTHEIITDSISIKILQIYNRIKNEFCYEAVWRNENSTERILLKSIQKDLDNKFNLKSRVDTVTLDCFAIVQSTNGILCKQKRSEIIEHIDSTEIICKPFSHIFGDIHVNSILPIVNDVTSQEPISMVLPKSFQNIEHLQKHLNNFGFDIKMTKRLFTVLRIMAL